MKASVLSLLAMLALGGIPSHSQSQNEMNQEAEDQFEKTDAKLNVLYKKVLAGQEDDEGRKKLIAAERAWVAFRDAEAAYQADPNRGGSIYPMVYATVETNLTKQRIAMLQQER